MTTFCQTARLAKYFIVDPKAKSLHGLFSDRDHANSADCFYHQVIE